MADEDQPGFDGVDRVFADTSFFYALFSARETHHRRAMAISQNLAGLQVEIVTTWDVVVETVTLLRYRASFNAAKQFIGAMQTLKVIIPTDVERTEAIDLFLLRAPSQRLSLCDVLSYIVVSTRLNWIPCLAFDADFAALGLTVIR